MDIDDIIYLVCLLSCIAFGPYYSKITDNHRQKVIGTGLGLLIAFVVSGFHILHCLISFFICAVLITQINPKKCHLASFIFMFGYLVFFRATSYFGIPRPPGHTNMIQMILTLKIVGAAFERNTQYLKLLEEVKKTSNGKPPTVTVVDYETKIQNITIEELFHYCFNYIGVLIGPYYRYRTFYDYFGTPFKDYADNKGVTLRKLRNTALYCALFVIVSYIWPFNYALENEFYEKRSFLYRLFYIWPTFFIFRMRIYTGLTLGESVCTSAGFGAYPDDSDVACGEGPRKDYIEIIKDASKLQYNFDTIKNIDVYNTEVCWTFREAMKHWNICVQYWLAVNVYKRFPSKKYRQPVTLLLSAFWHGFYPGHYFCIMGAPFYVPVEEMYNKWIRQKAIGLKRTIIDVLFWISKFYAFSYLGIAFLLLTLDNIWHYYSSVYHAGYVYYIVVLVVALVSKRLKKQSRPEAKQEKNL